MSAHRFRFFVETIHAEGDVVVLDEADVRHLKVLRPAPDALLELVDGAGNLFEATYARGEATLKTLLPADALASLAPVVLYAGLLEPQRWDVLVDHAVQAGAARIVPVAATAKEARKAVTRVERSRRIALAAAKQAKRRRVPSIAEPIALADVARFGPGVVCDADLAARTSLAAAVRSLTDAGGTASELSVVVGSASGIPDDILAALDAAGWQRAWLGPTVLRSELAAAVAVSATVEALRSID